jgi:two-component system, OmpR family, KDP operon response regulator KdpE
MNPAPTRGLRICVSEDDPAVLRLLETALSYYGHRVVGCPSEDAVLARVEPGAFDLLLLDLQMGPLGGLELLGLLQGRDVDTPAILMSSRYPTEFWSSKLQYANVSLLLKPFALDVLERAVADHRAFPGRVFR